MKRVAIVGAGLTKFGSLGHTTTREMFLESSNIALEDAGFSSSNIDAVYFGNLDSSRFEHQSHTASINASYLTSGRIPSTRIENACASGGVAAAHAFLSIASGMYETVLVVGSEKMTNLTVSEITDVLATSADNLYEVPHGITFPGLFALMARAHMHKFGTTQEQLASIAIKNHENALNNPYAQFHKAITMEKVLSSPMIADPLRLYDCSPITDGGAAIVLTTLDNAQKLDNVTPVEIIGIGQSSDSISLAGRSSLTSIPANYVAAQRAYKMAEVSPTDIDVAEVHDCFTIAEIICTEDLGFFKQGTGGKKVEEGATKKDGEIPINPSGGLKAKGHPIGASGVAQLVEITNQVRKTAGQRQISDANLGLTQNMGGSGATSVVHILKEVKK